MNLNRFVIFQVLKINMGQGPIGSIKFLLRPIGEIVIDAKELTFQNCDLRN